MANWKKTAAGWEHEGFGEELEKISIEEIVDQSSYAVFLYFRNGDIFRKNDDETTLGNAKAEAYFWLIVDADAKSVIQLTGYRKIN